MSKEEVEKKILDAGWIKTDTFKMPSSYKHHKNSAKNSVVDVEHDVSGSAVSLLHFMRTGKTAKEKDVKNNNVILKFNVSPHGFDYVITIPTNAIFDYASKVECKLDHGCKAGE